MTKKLTTDERLDRIEEHLGLVDTNKDPITAEGQAEADAKAKTADKQEMPEGAQPQGDAHPPKVNETDASDATFAGEALAKAGRKG